MAADLPEMPFLRNIGLILTYKCQVTCPHCIIQAGPHRTEEMRAQDAFDWIRQAAAYRDHHIRVLSLTGGEPFYDIGKLKQIADFGEACGFLVSAATNAFWATTVDRAVSILKSLSAIKMIAISTDVYHQVSIPFARVKNAILAAGECDVPFNVSVCTESEEDVGYVNVIKQLETVIDRSLINTAITFPAGRALIKIGQLGHQTTESPPVSACAAGSSPIIFPDGRVIACIGPVVDLGSRHPLELGSLRTRCLEEILEGAELNPILHAVRVWGPRKLISLLKEAGLADCLPARYIKDSVCNACYTLMASDGIVRFLSELGEDPEFRRKVAYARLYYLQEARMLELLAEKEDLEVAEDGQSGRHAGFGQAAVG